jgi:glucose-6-phosphate 1-dehydrogenase
LLAVACNDNAAPLPHHLIPQLAKKKTYPSLYELFLMGLLPERTAIVGYARSPMADEDANKKIRAFLKSGTDTQRDAFLALCTYRCGGYDDPVAFGKVRARCSDMHLSA